MGNWDVVDQILEFIPCIDFDKTTTEVSLFETTIRYLGGLLSGRFGLGVGVVARSASSDTVCKPTTLSRGPITGTSTNRPVWMPSSSKPNGWPTTSRLKVAFDTPSSVPDNNLFFNPPEIPLFRYRLDLSQRLAAPAINQRLLAYLVFEPDSA